MSDKEVRKEAADALAYLEGAAGDRLGQLQRLGYAEEIIADDARETERHVATLRAALSRGPLLLSREAMMEALSEARTVLTPVATEATIANLEAAQGSELRAVLEARLTDNVIEESELELNYADTRKFILDTLTEVRDDVR